MRTEKVTMLVLATIGSHLSNVLGVDQDVRPILLIGIPKTGGTSIRETLGMDPRNPSKMTEACEGVPKVISKHAVHDTATQAKSVYTPQEWDAAYKVSFVRSPWSRLVSLWAMQMDYIQQGASYAGTYVETCGCYQESGAGAVGASMGKRGVAPAVLKPGPSLWMLQGNTDPSVGNAAYACSFSYYLEHCAAMQRPVTQVEYVVEYAGEWSARLHDPFELSEGVYDPSKIAVDFIGRQEALGEHLRLALLAAGNSASVATACAASIVSSNGAWHEPYAAYYGSEREQAIASRAFSADARAFNYTSISATPSGVLYRKA